MTVRKADRGRGQCLGEGYEYHSLEFIVKKKNMQWKSNSHLKDKRSHLQQQQNQKRYLRINVIKDLARSTGRNKDYWEIKNQTNKESCIFLAREAQNHQRVDSS